MCVDSKHGIRGKYFQSIAKGLLEQPLEFIQKDYLKPQICSLIDEIVLHPSQKGANREVLTFLTMKMPLHFQEDDEVILPLLQQCFEPKDEIKREISKRTYEHAPVSDNIPKIVKNLRSLVAQKDNLAETKRSILWSLRPTLVGALF